MVDVVVVIATSMKRTSWLLERSLYSVYKQEGVQPLCIYVVDDNEDKSELGHIRQSVKQLREDMFGDKAKGQNFFHTKVIDNCRTKHQSGSGAWNTAAMQAYQVYGKTRRLYLALLDDDDAWSKNYLQQCTKRITTSKAKTVAVVSSFLRIENDQKKEVIVHQNNLNRQTFYEGNPGWQGSNTFVEIKAFWMAGGFDEAMSSTHDRDFAIRLLKVCEHKGYHISAIKDVLWQHYAHTEKRVTTGGFKHQGLDLFYNKFSSEMTPEVRDKSFTRAKKLFQYQYKPKESFEEIKKRSVFSNNILKDIIIGVVSSSVDNIRHQLQSILKQLDLEPQFSGYCSYIVMGNGLSDQNEIQQLLENHDDDRLKVEYICLRKQQSILSTFPFRDIYKQEDLNQKSIAYSRSLLQFKLWQEAVKQDGCIALVLDDDLLFEALCLAQDSVQTVQLNFFSKLMGLSEVKADIIISKYTDAPPLPFYSSLRVQLLDLISQMKKNDKAGMDWSNSFAIQDDYYYDLSSSHYQYLEMPLSIRSCNQTVYEGILQLGKQANACRPVLFSVADWNKILLGSDYHRGGIAIFNKIDLLVKVPHLSPMIKIEGKNKRSRRSDFISSIFLMQAQGVNIQETCFPLRHNRSLQKVCSLGMTKIALDVFGAVFYRSFLQSFQKDVTDKKVRADFGKNIREFIIKLEVTELRVSQLIHELIELIKAGNASCKQELLLSLESVKQAYTTDVADHQIRIIKKELQKFDVVEEIYQIKKILSKP